MTTGQPFLRHRENFIDKDLDFPVSCSIWFANGTYKVNLAQYTQLYTIHGTHNGTNISCVFAPLPNKRESTCTAELQKWQKIQLLIQPQTVINYWFWTSGNEFIQKCIRCEFTLLPFPFQQVCMAQSAGKRLFSTISCRQKLFNAYSDDCHTWLMSHLRTKATSTTNLSNWIQFQK